MFLVVDFWRVNGTQRSDLRGEGKKKEMPRTKLDINLNDKTQEEQRMG
jgi:hypothetical protein